VSAQFRVAIRTETGTVLVGPTAVNEFTLTVTGYEEYVNPCLEIGTKTISVVDHDYSVSFATVADNSPEELKWIEV
jgi:hypothetical protein